MDLREIGLGVLDWIRLSQDRDRWRAVVSAVMNLRVLAPQSSGLRHHVVLVVTDVVEDLTASIFKVEFFRRKLLTPSSEQKSSQELVAFNYYDRRFRRYIRRYIRNHLQVKT
jgi:hypothetical protein